MKRTVGIVVGSILAGIIIFVSLAFITIVIGVSIAIYFDVDGYMVGSWLGAILTAEALLAIGYCLMCIKGHRKGG